MIRQFCDYCDKRLGPEAIGQRSKDVRWNYENGVRAMTVAINVTQKSEPLEHICNDCFRDVVELAIKND